MDSPWLTAQEACDYARCTERTLRDKFPRYRPYGNNRVLYKRDDIDRVIAATRVTHFACGGPPAVGEETRGKVSHEEARRAYQAALSHA